MPTCNFTELDGVTLVSLRLEDAEHFTEDDGIGQSAVLQIDVGQEVFIERFQELRDLVLGPAGTFQQDDGPRNSAAGEIMQIDGRRLLAVAQQQKPLGRRGSQGSFPLHHLDALTIRVPSSTATPATNSAAHPDLGKLF